MQKGDFFHAAVLAVLPACATYGLNGLNEAINEKIKELDGYPEEAMRRRVQPLISEIQKGAYSATVQNAIALAEAITKETFP